MKIAFFFDQISAATGNGVWMQAMKWKSILEELGHSVTLLNPWLVSDLSQFDIIQMYSFSYNTADQVRTIYKYNKKIAIAPILDPCHTKLEYKAFAHCLGNSKLKMISNYRALYEARKFISVNLVRSKWEQEHMIDCFGYTMEQCPIIPLSSNTDIIFPLPEKEPFCLHISLLCDARKNVKRLIDASVKYSFPLVLAGTLRTDEEKKLFNSWIVGHDNIKYMGFVSEEEKNELYKKARVFALPSTNEGVGLVALEAASWGCDIVMTNIGGPKEYYDDGALAEIVNPFSIDEIGLAVCHFLDGKTYQPYLATHLQQKYSAEMTGKMLEKAYLNML